MSTVTAGLASHRDFVDAIGRAVAERKGYGAGKIGASERALLQYPIFLSEGPGRIQRLAFVQTLHHRASRLSGVFPAEAGFYEKYAEFHAGRTRQLDSVGVDPAAPAATEQIVRFHRIPGPPIDYLDQEPDRSTPANDEDCYLPHFAGKRILIVCTFAELLRERANRETFEAVWAKTGKRWFEPASVDALEFPYAYSGAAQGRYATSIDLVADVESQMAARDYDVALIAAGALGIPLAAAARSHGKVAIALGGHLQVLFGVLGDRWRARPDWLTRYVTDAWIDMPARYHPAPGDTVFEDGYW